MSKKKATLTPKTERVIGQMPAEFRRVKIIMREEVMRNSGGGTKWITVQIAEPVVIYGRTQKEIEETVAKVLEARD